MFCDRCGQQFLPTESVCTRCRVAPTRALLQLISLLTLTIAVSWNAFLALYFLPRLSHGHTPRLIHAWVRFSNLFSWYGWIAVALALLGWSFLVRRGCQLLLREWLARLLLCTVLIGGIVAAPLSWIPASLAPNLRSSINGHPGMGAVAAWGLLVAVIGLLTLNAETRDSLLGHGRALGLISLVSLLGVLAITTLGWSAAFH